MKRKTKVVKVTYKQSNSLSNEEVNQRLERAFDVLFKSVMTAKNENRKHTKN